MGLTDRRRAIVIFGDSLTQRSFEPTSGWGAALAHMYGRRCDVYNRGYGGYNTRWCRSQLPHLFPPDRSERPLLVTVMLGTNDAAIPEQVPTAVVPLDEYADNLTAIVRHVKSVAEHVVVMTPPCMDEPGRLRFQLDAHGDKATGKLDRTNANTRRYAEAAKAVAATCDVPCVDLFALTERESEKSHVGAGLFIDGIHFNAKGQEIVFRGLRRCLMKEEDTQGAADTQLAVALDPEGMDPDWPFGPTLRVAEPAAWKLSLIHI